MIIATRMIVAGSLVLLALTGCGSGGDDAVPVDTTSTEYLYLNVFNPCREMPSGFLAEHDFFVDPEPMSYENNTHVYMGCDYANQDYYFRVEVTNGPVSSAESMAPQTFRPTTVAGRNARIWESPSDIKFCKMLIEMKGGSLSFGVTPYVIRPDSCDTLMELAEELVPLLPPGI